MEFNVDVVMKEVPEQGQVKLVPPADYPAMVTETTLKPTKNQDGTVLHMKMKLGGNTEYRNETVMVFFNLQNTKANVQRIGQHDFARACTALGVVGNVADVEQDLIGKKAIISIEIEKASPRWNYDANRVRRFKPFTAEAVALLNNPPPVLAPKPAADPAKDAYYAATQGGTPPPYTSGYKPSIDALVDDAIPF